MKHLVLLLVIAFSLLLAGCGDKQKSIENPNIVLILTDDQGYGDVHLHQNDSIYTPTLDRIANSGMRLDNFYVSPVCAPTRASLLTGKYHLRTGVTWVTSNAEMMDPSEVTLAELLRSRGYRTGCFGKWHNGAQYPSDPTGQGFEVFTGFKAGHLTNYFNPVLESHGQKSQYDGYITDIITDEAIGFIENNQDKSFFCYIPYNAPHSPYEVPDRFYDRYRQMGMSERQAAVYGMVQNIDENIDRILDKLEQLKLTKETIVVFITDNGPQFNRYNAGMKGRKGWVNDGGVRVPAFIQWEGIIEPNVSAQLSAHIDILPTLLGLSGHRDLIPNDIDGTDLSPLLLAGELPEGRTLFTHFRYRQGQIPHYPGAVRNDSLRLVIDASGAHLLTRLLTDRAEEHDLSARYPELADALRLQYDNWISQVMPAKAIPALPIGYEEVSEIYLAAHESKISGNLSYKFSPNGWAHDWIIDWSDSEDRIRWDLDVHTTTEYKVEIQYTSPEEEVGSSILLTTADDTTTTTLQTPFVPELIPNQDRWPRVQEAYEQTWGWVNAGTLTLTEGSNNITMQALEIPGNEVAEIKGLRLTRN